jgi:hypothetical protein
MLYLTPKETARFWAKVKINGPEDCWPWTRSVAGGQAVGGYGSITLHGQKWYTHRIAFCLGRGYPLNYLDPSVLVMHTCDYPRCCNPVHLELGTHLSNLQDCSRKGRMHRGSKNGQAILTEDQVLQIKQRLAHGDLHQNIAVDFEVSRVLITYINSGRKWGWLHA